MPLMNEREDSKSYKNELSNFLDFLLFFAKELKKGSRQEVALRKAFYLYTKTLNGGGDNCISENFKLNPQPCSFEKRWREYIVRKFPNLLIIYLIDTIIEMLDIDPIETGKRLESFLPILKNNLESSKAWELVCQKPETEKLREVFNKVVVTTNLSIGDSWMLIFLLRHFNVFPDELEDWKFDCSVLDSMIPIMIRDYAHKLLFLKFIMPILQKSESSIEIKLNDPIPIHFPCPNCRKVLNFDKKDWGYIQLHSPDDLRDYHKCPICKKAWAIRISHIDEGLWNGKKGIL